MNVNVGDFVQIFVGHAVCGWAIGTRRLRGYITQATERAIQFRPENGRHTLWIPKRALRKADGTYCSYVLAQWFGNKGYEAWFIDRYSDVGVISAAR